MQTEAAPAPEPDTGFRIYLTLDKLEFLPEEPFFVTVTFANVGRAPITVAADAAPETGVVEYELLNSAGQRCGVWKAIAEVPFHDYAGRRLPPGGQYSACIDLSTQARISVGGAAAPSPFSSSPLWKPGRYALTAVYDGIPHRPEFGGELRSNTVSLEVLDLTGRPAADQGAYAALSETRWEGNMWVKLREEADAYARVLKDFPESGYAPWCRLYLAGPFRFAGNYDAAIRAYQATIRDLPRTRQALQAQRGVGITLYRARRADAAEAFRLLEEDPAVPDAEREKAAFYRQRVEKGIFD